MQFENEFKEQIDGFIEVNDTAIRDIFKARREILPQLNAFLYSPLLNKFTIAPCAVDPRFYQNDSTKDFLADMIFPGLLRKFNGDGLVVLCTALCHEAWVTQLKYTSDTAPSNAEIRRLQKVAAAEGTRKEIVMINYETEFSCTGHMMEIIRTPGQPPTLGPTDGAGTTMEMTGRFTGWLKKQPKLN